jgi:hypothetical protein
LIRRRLEKDEDGVLIGNSLKVQILKFLFGAYKPEYWYFELVETSRRLLMISVLSAIVPGSSSQAVLAILLSLVIMKLYNYFSPYGSSKNQILAEIGQYSVFLVFFASLIIQNNLMSADFNAAIGGFMIVFSMSVPATMIYYEYCNYVEEKKKDDAVKTESHGVVENINPSSGSSPSIDIELRTFNGLVVGHEKSVICTDTSKSAGHGENLTHDDGLGAIINPLGTSTTDMYSTSIRTSASKL